MTRLTFFFDRSVGLHDVPEVFREAGHVVVVMKELYPDGRDQAVGDDEWIADVSDRGWIAVTKDAAIVRDHAGALDRSTIRMFTFPNANMTGVQLAARVREHMSAIVRRSSAAGPFVDASTPTVSVRSGRRSQIVDRLRWPLARPVPAPAHDRAEDVERSQAHKVWILLGSPGCPPTREHVCPPRPTASRLR